VCNHDAIRISAHHAGVHYAVQRKQRVMLSRIGMPDALDRAPARYPGLPVKSLTAWSSSMRGLDATIARSLGGVLLSGIEERLGCHADDQR